MSNNAPSENTSSNTSDLQDFEAALTELETIINRMESGQLPLQQSLSAYKRGTELLGFCQKALADVEQQIRILNDANQLQPFAPLDD
ncbi:MAG TPA: exodeoxyribonuclease VII small subunit [Methylophilaceae bacterium]|nr:exodeoxyribonuclease VII small subunit [Methylophilaceae bacterium]